MPGPGAGRELGPGKRVGNDENRGPKLAPEGVLAECREGGYDLRVANYF